MAPGRSQRWGWSCAVCWLEGAAEGPVFPLGLCHSYAFQTCLHPMAHSDFQDPVSLETGSGSLFLFSFLGT